jgi:porphobilinogen synthase
MRRIRYHAGVRDLVRENRLAPEQLIHPLFVDETIDQRRSVPTLPGQYALPPDQVLRECREIEASGCRAVLLFGVPKRKDPLGKGAYDDDGVVQRAVRSIKKGCGLAIITDLCLCEYTDHGHCGVMVDGEVDNDATLGLYARIAVSQARAGADMVAPSGMMDGQVGVIRQALDQEGHSRVGIMAYSAKFCSCFYGPFRDLAGCRPSHGDRRSHQMDPANGRQALREMELDVREGADMLMVKPALPYLDVIKEASHRFELPLCAFQVSGEYAMVMAAAERGWIDHDAAIMESLISIRRAGADCIVTYFAKEAARLLEGK